MIITIIILMVILSLILNSMANEEPKHLKGHKLFYKGKHMSESV